MSTTSSSDIAEAAQACAETGWTPRETVEFLTLVFASEWSFCDRMVLAWRLVTNR